MRTNLEILLSDWGRWKATQDDAGLGYPSEAAFSKMRVDCDGYTGRPLQTVDEDVIRVNGAIGRLHPSYQKIIRIQYVHPGSWKVKPDLAGLSKTAYFEALKFSHTQLSHDMGGTYSYGYQEKCSGTVAA